MLPAYAGMIPTSPFLWRVISSAPRVCGDDPEHPQTSRRRRHVLPAYAGMIRRHRTSQRRRQRAPRVCGDDPQMEAKIAQKGKCSPRMRG